MSVEVEVKFLVDDLDEVRRRLLAAGGVAVAPRVYERNVRFDTDERLLQAFAALAQDSRVRLT
jgi:adenylate cyclase class IV